MHRLLCGLLLTMSLALAANANAEGFNWLRKAAKAGKEGAHVAAGQLSRKEVLAGSAKLGAGVVYVEVHGGQAIMDFGEAASAKTKRFVLSPRSAAELGPQMRELTAQGEVFVVSPPLGPLRVVGHRVAESTIFYKELSNGLLTPLDAQITTEVAQALGETVRREQIRVASMFASTDVDALQNLANAAGDRLLGDTALAADSLVRTMRELRGGVLIVVGHVEDTGFVARGARGEVVHTLNFDKLEEVARASDVTVVSAGCRSYCAGASAGFANKVTDVEMAGAIKTAFEADTTGDMLGAFGKHQPLLLEQVALDGFAESRRLRLAQLQEGGATAMGGSLAARIYIATRTAGVVATAWAALQTPYLVGLVASLLMFRTSRAAFLRVFPKLPSPALAQSRGRYALARIGRILLYMALSPFFALAAAVFILLGGWASREAIQATLWLCIRHPIAGLLKILRIAISAAVMLAIYIAGVAVVVVPGIALTIWAIGTSASTYFWLALAGCLAYWAIAVWCGWKAHKALHAWLDKRIQPYFA